MKKKDWILIVGILLVALVGFLGMKLLNKGMGSYAVVTLDGKEYGRYSLEKNQEIMINDTNLLKIENGVADMIEADCPDKLCVHQKAIQKKGETLVCLPNKIVVEIAGEAVYNEIDAVVN